MRLDMDLLKDSDTDDELEKSRREDSKCVKFIDRVLDCSDDRKSCAAISVGCLGFAIGVILLSLYKVLGIYSLAVVLLTAIPTIFSGLVCFCACHQAGEYEVAKSRRKRRWKKMTDAAVPPPYTIRIRDEPPTYSEVVVPTYSEVAADAGDMFKRINPGDAASKKINPGDTMVQVV